VLDSADEGGACLFWVEGSLASRLEADTDVCASFVYISFRQILLFSGWRITALARSTSEPHGMKLSLVVFGI
jgi:hypothetical protein